MNPRKSGLWTLVVLAIGVAAAGRGEERFGRREKTVTVMTQNLYLGADVAPVVQAALTDPSTVPLAVAEVWAKVRSTDFPARARALAGEIGRTRPDLIGLQEAALYRSQFPADSIGPEPTPATHVEYDFVELLVNALAERGLRYEVVAVSTGFDVELPRLTSFDPLEFEDLRLTEREVILAAADRRPRMKLSNIQAGHFETNLDLGFVVVNRGWASVDVKTRGEEFRFITTHLEADDELVRRSQSNELLLGPARTSMPVVLVGDFNSNANGDETSAAYFNLLSGGLRDAWSEAFPGEAGTTCCQDELLISPVPFSASQERIDLVFLRGDLRVAEIAVVGARITDKTPSGLWPSDHAGVVAEIELH
jgi:endonuclease/exonuclease/phosphatase family metal-dependent hydrolase